VSDNTAYSLQASYKLEGLKLFGGYEHIAFDNPSTGLTAGSSTIGGYVLAYVNNDAYAIEKTLTFYWAGAKYKLTPELELTGAYYGYKQNSYAAGAESGCSSSTVSSKCSGTLNAVSALLDYRMTKRFDVYGGLMWSEVSGGLANGYLNTSNVDPTVGVRYTF
jgi:predicted porin